MKKNNNKRIGENIQKALDEKGLGHDFLARAWNIDRTGVGRALAGKQEISADRLMKAADALEVSLHMLTYGYEAGDLDDTSERHGENTDEIESDGAVTSVRPYVPKMPGGIAEIDVLAGAGDGKHGKTITLAIGEESYSGHPVVAEWSLSDRFVEYEMNLTNKDTLILRVIGDSMMPTYLPGDRVIVDMRQNVMTVDGVYIISDGEEPPQIKRLHRVRFSDHKEIDVISDNPLHPVQRGRADQIHIIGRVAGRISAS